MDRKILILCITLTVVILFLSFRKEGYEEELKEWQMQTETLQKETIKIPPSFDIDSFIDNVKSVQEKQENEEAALDAFFEAAEELDVLGTSSDDASEAYATHYRNQIEYTRLLIQISQEKSEEKREDLREQLRAVVREMHNSEAQNYFRGEFSFDEVSGFIPMRQIVKVNNVVNTFSDPESVSYGPVVAQTTGQPEYSTINQYRVSVNARVPKCDIGYGGAPSSCLTKDGEPGSSGYIIGSSDSDEAFGSCAIDCLNADKCSGFSVKEDSTGAFYCKLTNNGFEKVQNESTIANDQLEQVYAIHEGFSENDWVSYLKNPLYFKMFNSAFDDNNCGDVPDVEECLDNGRNSKTKIENDGLPRDCEGYWGARVKGGNSSDWHSIDNVKTLSQRVNEGPNGSPAVCPGGRYYPYGGEDETYEVHFRKKPGGYDAINGGSCPEEDTMMIEVPCGAEEAPAPPPPDEVCITEETDEIGSFYKNDSGNYCVSDLKGASSGGMTVNRTYTVIQAPTGNQKCMYPSLKNVGDTHTIPNASPTVANPGYPQCPAHLFTDCVKKKSVGTCGSYSQGTCGTGKKIINYVVSQEPGRYGKSCDAYDRRNLPESNWNGGTTEETCEKPCNQGFCTARTLNQQSCPSECKQDDAGNCCVNVVSVEGEEGDATGVCVPSRYGDNQKYTGKNSLGWGTYSSASLDDWYRDSACRGIYFGDSGWDGLYMMNDGILGPSGKKPYTCHKSGGSPSYQDELKPFIDDMTFSWLVQNTRYLEDDAMKDMEDRSTLGWEGLLNNRGIDRAYGSEGQKSCHKTGNYGYEQWGYIDPGYCKYIDIKNYGQSNEKVKRQFWYDEMNKD